MAEWADSWRLLQRDRSQEWKALAPVLVLMLGTDRLIPLFDLSECDGSDADIYEQQVNFFPKITPKILGRYCWVRFDTNIFNRKHRDICFAVVRSQ